MKRFILATLLIAGTFLPSRGGAQWLTIHEQFYLPGSFNWQFRRNYPAADGLFNAFDYGHAILYEKLWNGPNAPVSELEVKEFDYITGRLLVNPPNLPLEEAAIEIGYVKIAPEAKMMFEWAHLLHRQIYDVLADERMTFSQKDSKVAELIRYYKTRKDLAFSSLPKSMELMEGQPYSLAFRKRYPKFNGLIWAYHWLQIGLYEPLLAGKTRAERQTGVAATVTRFRQMIEQPPTRMPRVMPMAPAVAPLFTARYPEAAIIFDNLHSMHDVISDVLANPSVGRDQKRTEILKAARRYRDNTSFVTKPNEWREMASMMGIQNMGGPATGFLPAFPAPGVERGTAAHHSAVSTTRDTTSSMDHSAMHTGNADMSALHTRLMADSVIRNRVNADPVLRDLMRRAMSSAAHPASAAATKPIATSRAAAARPAAKRPAVRRTTAPKKSTSSVKGTASSKKPAAPAAKPKAKPKADPMAGMDHSKMGMPPKK